MNKLIEVREKSDEVHVYLDGHIAAKLQNLLCAARPRGSQTVLVRTPEGVQVKLTVHVTSEAKTIPPGERHKPISLK